LNDKVLKNEYGAYQKVGHGFNSSNILFVKILDGVNDDKFVAGSIHLVLLLLGVLLSSKNTEMISVSNNNFTSCAILCNIFNQLSSP